MANNLFQKNNPKRQRLLKPILLREEAEELQKTGAYTADGSSVMDNVYTFDADAEDAGDGGMASVKMSENDVENYIQSLDELKACLHLALQLELSTIPPYLCGLYTIKDGSNTEAAALIRSIAVEEMLHMILVCNILNAITDSKDLKPGDKLFNVKEIIPDYPTPLPGGIIPTGHPDFMVQLLKFSPEALAEFRTIERPADPKQPFSDTEHFDSIGQFYMAIRYGLLRLSETMGEKNLFCGDPARQIGPEHYYGSGGKITRVTNLESAERAIEEIVGQGEGIDGTIKATEPIFGEDIEYAHYFKFQEIYYGRMYNANDTNFEMPVMSVPTGRPFPVSWSSVYNMKPNPKIEEYKPYPELYEKALSFNRTYVKLLDNINDAVSGDPSQLTKGIPIMYELKYQALELLNIPFRDGMCAGPTFEYAAPIPVPAPKP